MGAVVLAVGFALETACADDWPGFRGPARDGLTREAGLLSAWPAGGPRRVWLFENCGVGYSGPAIVGDRLYVLGSRDGVERLLCLDARSGEELWAIDLAPEYDNGWGNGPRATPTVDGDRVYALAAKGTLVCASSDTGQELWRADLLALGGSIPEWGYSESPLVDGERVVVAAGGTQGSLVALDRSTGERLWQSAGVTDGAHYSSTIVAELHGKKQYVRLLPEHLVGVAPESGEVLWSVPWPGKVAVIPTPVVRDNRVYVTSGYGVGCMLVEVDAENHPTVVYDNQLMKNHHGGVILLGDHVYGHSDQVGWVCQEFATGKRAWRERSALGKGAIAYADGRFYCLSEDDGQVALVAASPEGWQEHGRFKLDPQTKIRKPQGKVWTHPVIAGGRLYLRDQDLLFSFDVAGE